MNDDAKIALQQILDDLREVQAKKQGAPVIINGPVIVVVIDAKNLNSDEQLLSLLNRRARPAAS